MNAGRKETHERDCKYQFYRKPKTVKKKGMHAHIRAPMPFSYVFFVFLLFLPAAAVLLLAVFAAVSLGLLIRKQEDLIQTLLDRGDAARVLTGDDVDELLWKRQFLFVDNYAVLDDVDGDVMIDKTEYIQIELIDRALYLDDIFFAHLVAVCVFDDRDAAVHFIQLQVFVDRHALSCLDMVEYNTFI